WPQAASLLRRNVWTHVRRTAVHAEDGGLDRQDGASGRGYELALRKITSFFPVNAGSVRANRSWAWGRSSVSRLEPLRWFSKRRGRSASIQGRMRLFSGSAFMPAIRSQPSNTPP